MLLSFLLLIGTVSAFFSTKCYDFEGTVGDKISIIHMHPKFNTSVIGFYGKDAKYAAIPAYVDEQIIFNKSSSFRICDEELRSHIGCELGTFSTRSENALVQTRLTNQFLQAGGELKIEIREKGSFCIGAYSRDASDEEDLGIEIEHTFGYLTFEEYSELKTNRLALFLEFIGLLAFWRLNAGANFRSLLLMMHLTKFIGNATYCFTHKLPGDSSSYNLEQKEKALTIICMIILYPPLNVLQYWISIAKPEMTRLRELPSSIKWSLSLSVLFNTIDMFLVDYINILSPIISVSVTVIGVLVEVIIWRSFSHTLSNQTSSADFDSRLSRTRYAMFLTPWALMIVGYVYWILQLSVDIIRMEPENIPLLKRAVQVAVNFQMDLGVKQYFQHFDIYSDAVIIFLLLWIWRVPAKKAD